MAESDLLILIPARMASTRLPGKPLADIAGQPMIVQVLRRAQEAGIGPVAVATDSLEIMAAVEKAGGRAVMTRPDHVSGSDRIFEALNAIDPQGKAGIVVNVQGDLPTLAPQDLRAVLGPLSDPAVDIATLAAEMRTDREWESPSVVKVGGKRLSSNRYTARTFTRSVSLEIRDQQESFDPAEISFFSGTVYAPSKPKFFHHIGLYAYRRAALERFIKLPPSPGEMRENLEQLRAMDAGMRIDFVRVDSIPLGVDTPEDLAQARSALTLSNRNA